MIRHFIHYNRREVRLRFPADPQDPWFSELQEESAGFDRPRFHVTRAIDGPAASVKAGDTIWLVGQLYAPWGDQLPPTLDARIDVADVRPGSGGTGYRFAAAETSRWFALTECTAQLYALEVITAGAGAVPLWKDHARPIGHYLRRMREVSSSRELQEWEAGLKSRPLHFISYRICDGSQPAFDCAKRLFKQGVRVYFDRWCLPRRLAERREAVGDAPLDNTLFEGIHEAEVVWGIESPLYAAPGSYTVRERDLAQSLNKYRAVVPG